MSARRRWTRRTVIATSVAMVAILGTSAAAWAYWTSRATVNATATSANLTVTTANFDTINATLANSSLRKTGNVVVTNTTTTTSTQKSAVNIVFSATGEDAFRSNFSYTVWAATNVNQCNDTVTPGTSLTSGTWLNGSTLTIPASAGFAPNESRIYCVRTTAQQVGTWPQNGAVTFTPRVAAAITLANYSGSASQTSTLKSSNIFTNFMPPTTATSWYFLQGIVTTGSGQNRCLDRDTNNNLAIGWPCKSSGATNQAWRFDPVVGKAGYYTIRSNSTTGGATQVMQASGTTVATAAYVANQVNQQWTLQVSNPGYVRGVLTRPFLQIVNASSGQCISNSAGSTAAPLQNCDGSVSQQFLAVRALFTGTNGGGNAVSCTYSDGFYRFALTPGAGTMRYDVRLRPSPQPADSAFGGEYVYGLATNAAGAINSGPDLGHGSPNAYVGTFVLELYEDVDPLGQVGIPDPGSRVASGTLVRNASAASAENTCSLTGMG